nr:hypothetical protein CFP56_57566 [Quercus suber]
MLYGNVAAPAQTSDRFELASMELDQSVQIERIHPWQSRPSMLTRWQCKHLLQMLRRSNAEDIDINYEASQNSLEQLIISVLR